MAAPDASPLPIELAKLVVMDSVQGLAFATRRLLRHGNRGGYRSGPAVGFVGSVPSPTASSMAVAAFSTAARTGSRDSRA